MACTSPSLTVESYDDVVTATTSGMDRGKPLYKRRHSSFHPRRRSSTTSLEGDDRLMLKASLKALSVVSLPV